jgi:hypothetical protein
MCRKGHSIGGEKILGVWEGKTPIFIPAKLISYMSEIEYRKQARRCRARAWQPQEEVPREYRPSKAERDGKHDEQQELSG